MSNKDFHNITRGRIHAKNFAEKTESVSPLVIFIVIVIVIVLFVAKVVS